MGFTLFSAIIFCWIGCGSVSQNNNIKGSLISNDSIPANKSTIDTLTFIAVGDIMFGSNFPGNANLPPNDGADLLKGFTEILKNADITFGNAEGVFLDAGGTPKGTGNNVYCFRQPRRYAKYFTDNGFNLLSLANNHVADFGDAGLKSTVSTLQALPIQFAGLVDHPTAIITIRNTKIGLAAFAPHNGCVQLNDYPGAIAIIKKLKAECDIVLVSFHAGAEGKNATRVPRRTEIFFNQNRGNVYEFAHRMIDAGADIVLGHGPHVPRGMELYNNKFIAYSLGNFCTYGMFSLTGVSGIAPLLKIYVNGKGDFINGTITSVKQEGEGGPLMDEKFGAYKLIKELSALDFPESNLKFPDSINITK